MSWEHTRYEARCEGCGRVGVCIRSSDDWNRSATRWEGFDSTPPNATAVGRKRVDVRDLEAVCTCGDTRIVVGEILKD